MTGGIDHLPAERHLDRHLAQRLAAWLGPERLAALGLRTALDQWRRHKLLETIGRAARESRHYRRRLAGWAPPPAETPPADILAGLPFTRPEELAAAPEDFLAVPHDEVEALSSVPTTGSAGPSKRIFSSAADLAETVAFFREGLRFLVSPGQRLALLMPGPRPGSVGDLVGRAMAELGVEALIYGFPVSERDCLQALRNFQPTALVGLPGHILSLAVEPASAGLSGALKRVLFSGEPAGEALRARVEAAWRCEAFMHYGLTEMGLGGAVECPWRNGPHLREADLLVEILGDDGRPLPPGGWGEIVITSLTREALPLLRYRTGDLGRLAPEPCGCGSVFTRLETRGRRAERLPLGEGRSLGLDDLDGALLPFPWLRGYQAVFDGELHIYLRTAPEAPADAAALAAERLGRLEPPFRVAVTTREFPAASGPKRVLLKKT